MAIVRKPPPPSALLIELGGRVRGEVPLLGNGGRSWLCGQLLLQAGAHGLARACVDWLADRHADHRLRVQHFRHRLFSPWDEDAR